MHDDRIQKSLFTMSPNDLRSACFKDLTLVHEGLLNKVPTIFASCPHCRRLIVSHRIGAPWEENAEVILKAHEHLKTCIPWNKKKDVTNAQS